MEIEFKTTTTMKEYNNKKWWIDPNIVTPLTIFSETLQEAIRSYVEIVKEKFCIDISKNAIRKKQPMYIGTKTGDSKQVGYVITGKTLFEDRNASKWSEQYIDLWITIKELKEIKF